MTEKKIRIIHYGLGPIGIETAKLVLRKTRMEIVGAVDIAPDKAGRDLGEILGLPERLNIPVSGDAKDLFRRVGADVVIHTASSRIRDIAPQLIEMVEAGLHVVSSSEELLFPMSENSKLLKDVHDLAVKRKVSVLGTGVNPGFVMDALPLFLTGVCEEVESLRIERVVDAASRRYPLQKKIGAGMTEEEFRDKTSRKLMGHVGLVESLNLVAHHLGIPLDDVVETIDPVLAEKPVITAYFDLKKGDVAGIHHVARGIYKGEMPLLLVLDMYVGAPDPHDSIVIRGTPNIQMRIDGGVAGDQATAAVLVNTVPAVIAAKPGIVTVKDLPSPHFVR
ncbi:MAG TPA: hypothetical protein PKY58_12520 [Syntrophales bacterium]|nr:hypothetical protein [Syntrophales bacterium]HPX12202.1 hypothetical protein [Syntrophales bacterium]HQN79148.1 hypothetical protein [Syntrophales bacterium]HQQ28343.1 hypothetical protein [Syntrophales bacterium]